MTRKRQFFQFMIVGVISTVLNLASRYVFQQAMSYEWALIGATVVGVLSAFLMNRWWVFRSTDGRLFVEMGRFIMVNLVGICLTWGTAVLLYRHVLPAIGLTYHADLVAHAIGIAVPVVPHYFAHRIWTFRRSG